MPLLNYTTKIDADKTAGEISKILRKIGASSVLTDYDPTGEFIIALSFKMRMEGDGREIAFRLPCDWQPVLAVMQADRKVARSQCTQEQAVRVSWRIVKDWVEAQAAIIETKMVSTAVVFLPYAIVKGNLTLGEKMMNEPGFLLGDGN